jgi:hypothetical protein
MDLVLQFPFADARRFISLETNRLPLPAWPLAREWSEFVRSFGQVRKGRGGIAEWPSDQHYCEAKRALRVNPALTRQGLSTRSQRLDVNCIFRRFFSDGIAVCRVEVGFRTYVTGLVPALDGNSLLELIESFLEIKASVPSRNGLPRDCELLDSARLLAAHYLAANTRRIPGETIRTEPYWFQAGEPLLLVEFGETEVTSLPKFSTPAMDLPDAGVQLHHCWITRHGRLLPVWFLKTHPETKAVVLWLLRSHLVRLHAERESVRRILSLIVQKKITITPKTEPSDELQDYLLRSMRLFSRRAPYGFEQAKLLDAVQSFHDLVSPGDRPGLLSQLSKIRRNVLRKVDDFTQPRENAAGSVHVIASTVVVGNVEKIGGDVLKSYNVTISGNNNNVPDLVVAETIQNSFNRSAASKASDEQKELLATLHQQIVDLSKQLSPDKAQQVAGDLETFTKEVASPSPRKQWYDLSSAGLIEAANTVATMAGPVTTTVKAILSALGLITGT